MVVGQGTKSMIHELVFQFVLLIWVFLKLCLNILKWPLFTSIKDGKVRPKERDVPSCNSAQDTFYVLTKSAKIGWYPICHHLVQAILLIQCSSAFLFTIYPIISTLIRPLLKTARHF